VQTVRDTIVVLTESIGGGSDLLPLWTGLIGGVLGFAATYLAARFGLKASQDAIAAQEGMAMAQLTQQNTAHLQELRATVISANRVKWIEHLRTEVAAYTSGMTALADDLEAGVPTDELRRREEKVNQRSAMIALLLNHEEVDSLELKATIEKFGGLLERAIHTPGGTFPQEEFTHLVKQVGVVTRRITKAEWIRVKGFE
jgi:hypothetical protein